METDGSNGKYPTGVWKEAIKIPTKKGTLLK
jgi:hypothetical protein